MASRFDANHHDKKTKTYSGQFSPKVLLLPVKMSLNTGTLESDNGKSKGFAHVFWFQKDAFRWDLFNLFQHSRHVL